MTAVRYFTSGLHFLIFRDIQEPIVSSVWLLLLRYFIKSITENKDSQANVDENTESNAVAKCFIHGNFFNGIPTPQ